MKKVDIKNNKQENAQKSEDEIKKEAKEKVKGMSDAEKIIQITQQLEDLANDRRVPRNVRATIIEAISVLKDEKESESVRLNTVISIMDEVSNDTNLQSYTRTQIWAVVSMLEAAQA